MPGGGSGPGRESLFLSKWPLTEKGSPVMREGSPRIIPFRAATQLRGVATVPPASSGSLSNVAPAIPSEAANDDVPCRVTEEAGVRGGMTGITNLTVGSNGYGGFELPGRIFGRRERASADVSGVRQDAVLLKTATAASGVVQRHRDVAQPIGDTTEAAPHEGGVTVSSIVGHSCRALSEGEFISDVLFMWMGVDRTKYFTYDEASHRYAVNAEMGTVRQRQAAVTLQECGWLAHQIDDVLGGSNTERSFLQQSLRSAVRRQLLQYHCLVASFRERRSPPMTFSDLVVAFKRVQPKLHVLFTILRETESVKGGELASKLQRLVQQGSTRLSALLSDVYMEAVSPLLYMAVSSITKGEILDPFNEFFVKSNPRIDNISDAFWSSKFALLPEMLPTTVPRALAEQVMLVTKNVSFIRNCCRCKQWHMDPAIVAAAQNASFDTISAVVRDAVCFTNKAVLKLIREEFHLDNVFRMVNAFLLVGNGGFYELLIHRLDPVLSRLSHMVQTSIVRDHMQSTLLDIVPYTRNLDTDLFSMMQCELVKDDKIIGWDAFLVTMSVPSPLNNVFDLTSMKVYRRLFRIMFKVKRAEVALKKSWRQSVVLDRIIGRLHNTSRELTAWREVAADAHLLGLQLNHFVNNLWSYLVAEVSTVSWDLLMKALRQCTSLDDIRAAHIAYLQYLTLHSLLHGDCASMRQNIESVLSIVRQYVGAQALLTSLLERGSGDVFSIKCEYQRLADDFQREITSLLTTLEEQHLQFDFLNFLLLRLNFNYFYHDTLCGSNTEF
ncbi:putative gamma-tubulin complex subunit [Trypanosoma rangeli]|uniref:Putative gamma-tubulin complex subunit n=1 Tax=Trypanosoma rangeli TaxID=5698 RepID=A0A422MYN6_TRYRA|nr:putative gamma-tubulin complex subunit [Trypanosoma rangeli]RNE98338.1 putative gamma-tubulin complex subunit [Trypanosoma rangeli]|eukprot:RNE98338.1 putative gamma-tubulin complex subunit [Trypanosoma rangeli]